MGMFCVNFHFRTQNEKALVDALTRRGIRQHHVFPAVGEWTSLCEQRASEQDDQWIRELAGDLSADLQVAAIAFLVHDSDIACYWLFENGQSVDEYNSCPDYFDDSPTEKPTHLAGQPHILLRYCRSGIREEDVAAILGEHPLFAEGIIEKLADALGIDSQRALSDYRHLDRDGGPGDEGDDDDDSGPRLPVDSASVSARLAQWLGIGPQAAPADPTAVALVQAAVNDDTDQIDKLLAEGVAIDGEAPTPMLAGPQMAELRSLMPGGAPEMAVPMTPLLAAVYYRHRRAAARLLERGADPNQLGAFGTPVHTAITSGEPELLQLLLEHGGSVSVRDARGQTPLQALSAARKSVDSLVRAQEMMHAMGGNLGGLGDRLAKISLPTAGWDACERLLKAHRAP